MTETQQLQRPTMLQKSDGEGASVVQRWEELRSTVREDPMSLLRRLGNLALDVVDRTCDALLEDLDDDQGDDWVVVEPADWVTPL
mmetsp:Transcript_17205/g.55837  ORF Transcript_17205/g.55837 Transcript_17205/m.55837 type:complete len:85 (-) Transcript_17205:395-649(-)